MLFLQDQNDPQPLTMKRFNALHVGTSRVHKWFLLVLLRPEADWQKLKHPHKNATKGIQKGPEPLVAKDLALAQLQTTETCPAHGGLGLLTWTGQKLGNTLNRVLASWGLKQPWTSHHKGVNTLAQVWTTGISPIYR